MRNVMSAEEMRAVDRYMIEQIHIPGLILMENAAMGTARLVMEKKPEPCVVHVFCGTGNNGGDGLACARILLARGYDVYVAIVGNPENLSGDAKINYEMFGKFTDRVLSVNDIEDLYSWRVPKAEVIIDALFGIGLSRDVMGVQAEVISSMNAAQALRVSVDIPSGIDADTGRVLGTAVRADCTATFQYPKIGHYLYPGREHTGELRVITIGIDKGVEDIVNSRIVAYESDDPDILVPKRPSDSNKGTYGRLLLVAGSRGMAGAAVMCAKAAYAAGTGVVTVAAPWAVIDVMQNAVPEAVCRLVPEEEGQIYSGSIDAVMQASAGKTAAVVGPGLGAGKGLKAFVSDMLTTYDVCRVVDADALNALDKDLKILAHIRGDVIFTPHPLEFARLLGTEVSSVLEHPLELATAFAKKCRVTLVLKGATTIIAAPDGEVALVAAGSPGMAKAGSGDVLAGTIAGLAAQGATGYEAAVLGVYLCAMAGEAAADSYGEYSCTPLDTIRCLGKCIKECVSEEVPLWGSGSHEVRGAAYESTGHAAVQAAQRTAAIQAPKEHTGERSSVLDGDERLPSQSESDQRKLTVGAASESRASAAAEVQQRSEVEAQPVDSPPPAQGNSALDVVTVADEPQQDEGTMRAAGIDEILKTEKSAAHETIAAPIDMDGPERVRSASRTSASGIPVPPAIPESNTSQNSSSPAGRAAGETHSGRGRMSARDIRPPRIPVKAAQEPSSSTGDTTKVVESVQNTLTAASKGAPDPASSTRQQKRAEKRRQEKQARQIVSEDVPDDNDTAAEERAEELKRERLNQEIQKELNIKKNQSRTRRRIG